MIGRSRSLLVAILVMMLISCGKKSDEYRNALEFISAADMRNFVINEKRSVKHFTGALETIKKLGAGSFLISTGDIDPPEGVRQAIDQVLGKDYPWYPVVGNHELDVPDHMVYLRNYNNDGLALPHLVRKGPPGCEETTYSFDWANCHFTALNQYYDGTRDDGSDGNMVPELLQWLEEDLSSSSKQFLFVLGHEPIFPMPDMFTGRLRHYDDSINKYMDNAIAFLKILQKYKVRAYICGHTHNTSYCSFNGVWQIDTGHSRGLEGISPEIFFNEVLGGIESYLKKGLYLDKAVKTYYSETPNQKDILKGLDYMDLCGNLSYKEIREEQAVQGLIAFYRKVQEGPAAMSALHDTFWAGADYSPSTFIKFYVGKTEVKAEFFRDNGRGGDYALHKTLVLN